MRKELISKSKFLSMVLRHKPQKIGLTLDQNGWVGVDDLLQAMKSHGAGMSRYTLNEIVATNNKKRFEFDESKENIRACQGHSVDVDLGLRPQTPPDVLYHGTDCAAYAFIKNNRLSKMKRQHVHLSRDIDTAKTVAKRHHKHYYIVLSIDAKQMCDDGFKFFLSKNGVWLTDHVPYRYISVFYDSLDNINK